jgi:hypothetical protein
MKVFSINAIADLLERDRATVTRALRHVPPDAFEKKQPRWRLATAVTALDALPGTNHEKPRRRAASDGEPDPRITEAYDNFQEALEQLQGIEDIEQRRAFAREKIGPIIAYNNKHTRQWSIENGNSEQLAQLSTEQLWHMSINVVRHFCEWTDAESYDELVIPNDDWSADELREHRARRKVENKKLLARLQAMKL